MSRRLVLGGMAEIRMGLTKDLVAFLLLLSCFIFYIFFLVVGELNGEG